MLGRRLWCGVMKAGSAGPGDDDEDDDVVVVVERPLVAKACSVLVAIGGAELCVRRLERPATGLPACVALVLKREGEADGDGDEPEGESTDVTDVTPATPAPPATPERFDC